MLTGEIAQSCKLASSHSCTYSGPIHFTLSGGEVKLPSGRLTVGSSQCDMLGKSGGAGEGVCVCVWVEATDIRKDANTDSINTCRGKQGTCEASLASELPYNHGTL